MTDIENFQFQLPEKLSKDVINILFRNVGHNDTIQLIITIEDTDLNVKDFSTYLHLVYWIDGFLSKEGAISYSRRNSEQIRISKIEQGSLVVFVERMISEIGASNLVIIYLVLKLIKELAFGSVEFANKYYDTKLKQLEYQEKRQTIEKNDKRKVRKQIREIISQELDLTDGDKTTKEKLVDIIEMVYFKNTKKLNSALRFDEKKVKEIILKLKRKD